MVSSDLVTLIIFVELSSSARIHNVGSYEPMLLVDKNVDKYSAFLANMKCYTSVLSNEQFRM